MKRWIAQVFKVWKTRKLQKAFWYKEEEEEELQRDFKACQGLIGKAKVFKIVVRKIDWKCKTKPCFYRLFMSGQEDHLEEL